jgi:transportin-1
LNIKPIFTSHNSSANSRKEEQEEADEEDELSEQQTIRKKSAVILETFSIVFPSPEILKYALPIIHWKLSSTDQWQRESGLLALGALSKGCFAALSSQTPNFLPYLLLSIQENSNPSELRSIACWVLSRYAGWFFEENQEESGK